MVDLIKNIQQRLKAAGITVSGSAIPRTEIKAKLEALKLEITADNFEEIIVTLIDAFTPKALSIPVNTIEIATPLSQIPVQLTTTQKESLTEIKVTQLGFSLGKDEILSIMSLVDTSITDAMEYMDAVTGHIQTYLTNRNNLVSKDISNKVNNVRQIINSSNDDLNKRFSDGQKLWTDLEEECRKAVPDFKSAYGDSLESIRELIEIQERRSA